jgi:hypothetical protein
LSAASQAAEPRLEAFHILLAGSSTAYAARSWTLGSQILLTDTLVLCEISWR